MPYWKSYFDKVSVCQSIWVFHILMAYGISHYNETRITEVRTKRAYLKCLYVCPDIYFTDMNCYWTYQGSLTTPPLSENVTWLISQNIMGLSEKQVSMVRLWKHAIQGNQASLLMLQFILTVSYTINFFYDAQSTNRVSSSWGSKKLFKNGRHQILFKNLQFVLFTDECVPQYSKQQWRIYGRPLQTSLPAQRSTGAILCVCCKEHQYGQ